MRTSHLYIAVFFSGLTTLAAELAASRLLENHFGTSNLIYAAIIGLILIYLTLGYFIGGRWADRSPYPRTFLQVLAWGAFTIGLVPLASRPILRIASDAFDQLQLGALLGSFVVTMILFIIPITLLGTASPFAIRLAIKDADSAGSISGRIYAISTLGSFIGTFLPGLLLVPTIGTYRTFLAISGLLLIVALYLLWRTSGWRSVLVLSWMPAVIVLLAFIGVNGFDKSSAGLIYEAESSYNYIQVQQDGDFRYLRLNEGQGIHSIYNPTQLLYAGPWEQVLAAPYFNAAPYDPASLKSMAIVGLAAGTTARQAAAAYGSSLSIDGYEIDPKIVEVGRRFFDMNQPNLNVIIQDGRYGLSHSPRKYQVISIDAYRPPYIPWHLTTREFFQEVRDHLTPDGVVTINVGRAPNDRRMIEVMSATLQAVFPSVYVVDLPETFNSILYATVQPTNLSNLDTNLVYLHQQNASPLILFPLQTIIDNLQPTPTGGQVFTDDQAPVEWITNNMVLRFLFTEDTSKATQ
jgi:spermidine synthase